MNDSMDSGMAIVMVSQSSPVNGELPVGQFLLTEMLPVGMSKSKALISFPIVVKEEALEHPVIQKNIEIKSMRTDFFILSPLHIYLATSL